MKKTDSKDKLFKHILKLWLDDELQIISEWCIGDRDKAVKNVNKSYNEYLELWNKAKEKQ